MARNRRYCDGFPPRTRSRHSVPLAPRIPKQRHARGVRPRGRLAHSLPGAVDLRRSLPPRQGTAARRRSDRTVRLGSFLRGFAAVTAVAVLLAGGWLWVRDSSLARVKDVTVTGATTSDAARIRSALERAARDMTTLHVREQALNDAVAPYPERRRPARAHRLPARDGHRGARAPAGRRDRDRRAPHAGVRRRARAQRRPGRGARFPRFDATRVPARPRRRRPHPRRARDRRRRPRAAARAQRAALLRRRTASRSTSGTARRCSSAPPTTPSPSGPPRRACWPSPAPPAPPISTSARPAESPPAGSNRSPRKVSWKTLNLRVRIALLSTTA